MSRTRLAALFLFLMTMAPAPARADVLLIPFMGVNFGGDSGKDFSDAVDASRFNWGGSLAFMGGGIFGMEGDFSYSPDFFGKTDVGGSSLFTATGSLLLGIPFGGQQGFGIRPYALAGAGVMHTSADFGGLSSTEEDNVTWSAGGGVMLFFGTRVGIRGDFRYFRTFDDLEIFGVNLADSPGKLDFTRTSLGLIVRF
jgi:hypothetical protein